MKSIIVELNEFNDILNFQVFIYRVVGHVLMYQEAPVI